MNLNENILRNNALMSSGNRRHESYEEYDYYTDKEIDDFVKAKVECLYDINTKEKYNKRKTTRSDNMDLNFLNGMSKEEQVASSDNTMNYVVMKNTNGDITFTYDGDDRLDKVFKDYEKIGLITQVEHSELLNTINTCEWDLKIDYVDGEFRKVEKYTPEEKAKILLDREIEKEKSYYKSEKELALAIEEDYRLGLYHITDEDMINVKTYIKSIQPKDPNAPMVLMAMSFDPPKRPEIMQVYEDKRNNGVL